jgi:3-hydroxyisobutyrate dehydrogenase-like beta-hydroxyacid dehydrogenase
MAAIGIVGLGKMGRPIARHLIAHGHSVVGCDPSAAARNAAAAIGVDLKPTPKTIAAETELVFIVVGFDSEVETVIFAEDGLLSGARPGLTIAIGSTISPSYAASVARRSSGRDIVLLDVPSTRGEQALEAGQILLLGGGDKAAFERWTPVLRTFASDIFHLGAFGAGQVAKMVNNLILWACMSANDEGLRLAQSLGVDPELLRTALDKSSAQNWSLTTRAEDRPIPWAEKDMNIVLREADKVRLSLPLCGTVKEVIKGIKIRRGIPMPTEVE